MKKIIFSVVFVLAVLSLSCVCFADIISVPTDNNEEYKDKIKLYAFENDGLKIYETGRINSRVLDVIPFETVFYAEDAREFADEITGESDWYKTEYNGNKGYVYKFNIFGLPSEDDLEILLTKTQPLYKGLKESGDVTDIEVPQYTTVKPIATRGPNKYYIDYNGHKGFVLNATSRKTTDYIKVFHDGAVLYSEPDDNSEILEEIPIETILKADWEDAPWFRVMYNGKIGWVKAFVCDYRYIPEKEDSQYDWYVNKLHYYSQAISSYLTDEYNELVIAYEEQNIEKNNELIKEAEEQNVEQKNELTQESNIISKDNENETIEPSTTKSSNDYLSKIIIIIISLAVLLCILILVIIVSMKKNKNQ